MKLYANMKTITSQEQVTRSRFGDCPNCKNHTLKLKRTVQVGRCRNCRESYKIVIIYVKEEKKPRAPTKTEPVNITTKPDSTLPSWQIPSDNSLFGPLPVESNSNSIFSDSNSSFGKDEKNGETPTGGGQ